MLTRTFRSQRVEIRYYISHPPGDSAGCIVFTHGFCADHSIFDLQLNSFTDRYDVVTWDIPLHGASRPYENYSTEAAAGELLGILDAEELTGPAVLVGHSVGTFIHRVFAAMHPERVRGIVEISGLLPAGGRRSFRLNVLSRSSRIIASMPFRRYRRIFAGRTCITDRSRIRIKASLIRLGRGGTTAAARCCLDPLPALPAPAAPDCPVLSVIGESERLPLYGRSSRSDGTVVLPRAGHYPTCDAPAAFNRELDGFIGRLPKMPPQ